MESILVLIACLSNGECIPVVGKQAPQLECLATSQQLAAAWIGDHPAYRIKRMGCVQSAELQAILGRAQA